MRAIDAMSDEKSATASVRREHLKRTDGRPAAVYCLPLRRHAGLPRGQLAPRPGLPTTAAQHHHRRAPRGRGGLSRGTEPGLGCLRQRSRAPGVHGRTGPGGGDRRAGGLRSVATMGTAVEMYRAYAAGRLVFTVSPMTTNWAIRFLSTRVFADLAEFEAFVRDGRAGTDGGVARRARFPPALQSGSASTSTAMQNL